MVAGGTVTGQTVERRLAAIVAADVVGYSRMMGADEVRTFRALQAHQRELVAPAVAKYRGHIFKTTGDGVLVEFGSIVDAVACAVMVQRAMLSRNAGIPDDRKVVYRVGINLGDVIIDGADVFGDGVNVAARLESVCEPGGVMISRTVHDQIRAKLDFAFEYLGERELKNIAAPVGVYGLSSAALAELPEEELTPPPETAPKAEVPARRPARTWRTAAVLAAALLIVGVVVGLGVMVREAAKSHSVIVDQFDAPPALAEQGMSGKVVAGGVLNELVRLQMANRTSAEKRSLSNPWTHEIGVEEPVAGLSLTALDRLFRAQFGDDTHIDGSLVQMGNGELALSVRGTGVLSKTFSGSATDLAKLTTQAAEYVYGQSQPSLFAFYLDAAQRYEEAESFCRTILAGAPESEKPFVLNAWGIATVTGGKGDLRQSLALFRQAVKLKPDYWVAIYNVGNALVMLGDEEGAWRNAVELQRAAGGRPGKAREALYEDLDALTWNLQAGRAAFIEDAAMNGGNGTNAISTANGPPVADIDVRLHDPGDAEFQLQTGRDDSADAWATAFTHFVRSRLAAEAGDTAQAAKEMEAFAADLANPAVAMNLPGYNCWVAPAEEAVGHRDKADAVLQSAGTFVDCYRFKADILDGRDNWPAAQKAYQAAVDLAPDLPAAYYSWGVALFRHGDMAGAKAKLEQANQRGPHWADPLKAWGDVLAKEGHWREALAKYDDALQYAPAWTALHAARDEAARHAG